ncbi:NAC domain [Sesbania bispinosa]|nr:NAC domain [Sesbania bispinosa]
MSLSMSQNHSHDDTITSAIHDDNNKPDDHAHDMVMPGFRFHPTEEELVEFYLRRKVEGKRFNVELITFLDLYRYDPWELPALAAIGEKEWYFYVPRDRKYRNGDRPNRVTTSGYWKATGADRMIRTENFRSIGLKKTLVFYSGKAPKGLRTSWIMNEYRLPQHETERYQKAEISLCRVYKRAGVEDHPSLPRCLPTRPSSSHSDIKNKPNETLGQMSLLLLLGANSQAQCLPYTWTTAVPVEEILMQQSKQPQATFFPANIAMMDDLNRLVSYQQQFYSFPNQFSSLLMQPPPVALNSLPISLPTAFSERQWEWNPTPEAEANREDNNTPFK